MGKEARGTFDISQLIGEVASAAEAKERVKGLKISGFQARQLRRYISELQRREMESTRLYEPLANQLLFHQSKVSERLLRGSNRGGKTLPAAMEVALAVTGRHPWVKYPRRNGRAFLVGKNIEHLGSVMWRKLSRADESFRMIKDLESGRWRAYRPWTDWERKPESKPMLPMIPQRMIRDISWYEKKSNTPRMVVLNNGWELSFFSSEGKPPQGQDVDLAWFDEEIIDPEWYPEISARLLDRAGKFIWSATPQAATQHLWELHERCEEDLLKDPQERICEEFLMKVDQNKFMDPKALAVLKEKLRSQPDQYKVRIEGEFLFTGIRVYPQFNRTTHVVPYFDPPPHWTCYAIIDPGHSKCATMFLAVPPPKEANRVVMFDVLYISNCNARTWGAAMKQKVGNRIFQEWIIDDNGSRRTEGGSGKSMRQLFSAELKRHRLRSVGTGFGFRLGSNKVQAGLTMAREWLEDSPDGEYPYFTVMDQCAEEFIYEIGRYQKKRLPGGIVTDDPVQRNNHLMDCFRYAAAHGCRYVTPPKALRKTISRGRLLMNQIRERFGEGKTNEPVYL